MSGNRPPRQLTVVRRPAAALAVAAIVGGCGPGRLDPARTGGELLRGTDNVAYLLRGGGGVLLITAIYGTGERPAPSCPPSLAVSDVAFQLQPGDTVEITVERCGEDGLFVEDIAR